MQAGKRYTLFQTVNWTRKYLLIFIIFDSIPILLYHFFDLEWLHIPWQPISLIGIAVAFYLGFKNNSSYERLWEARKIWGGIVNTSRSFTVMARDFVNNDMAESPQSENELKRIRKNLINRHIAWLHAMTLELRKVKDWEHQGKRDNEVRKVLGLEVTEKSFDKLKKYLPAEEFDYIMTKGNRSSHILSQQSKQLMQLRQKGIVEHFRHLQMQDQITEMYTLQGKSERIKNFPFPRQYATVNYFFVVLFIMLLPFGMLDVFIEFKNNYLIWLAIPFSVIGSWVFWMMEMIGDYSENPFEGTYNDVPITQMATGIEIDILQMLDETDLPEPVKPMGKMKIVG
ncbi:MAG: bestrophin family ion channel [Fulvivirga sp.]|nr:bestrophin family ion channel [Fulvivirga sp.]